MLNFSKSIFCLKIFLKGIIMNQICYKFVVLLLVSSSIKNLFYGSPPKNEKIMIKCTQWLFEDATYFIMQHKFVLITMFISNKN